MTFTARGLYASSSKEPAARRPRWLLLLGGLVAIVALIGAAGLLVSYATVATEERSEEFTGVTALEIDNTSTGDVRITAAEEEAVTVTRTLRDTLLSTADDEIEQVDGTLLVESDCAFRMWWASCSVDYDVRVPADTAVTLELSTGNIVVDGVEGDLDLRASTGNVELFEVAGDVTIRSTTGDVMMSDTEGAVDVRTTTGNVRAHGAREEVRVANTTGNIELLDVEAPSVWAENTTGNLTVEADAAEISAQSTTGNIHIAGQAETEEISARSTTGNISITVPEEAGPFRITGSSTTGNREYDVATDSDADALIDATTTTGDVGIYRE